MRLSERSKKIIELIEGDGYVWLSHLSVNAQMRFRNKTKKGFKGYMKIEGLTFVTPRVADMIRSGCKEKGAVKMTKKEQFKYLENLVVELERDLFLMRGYGTRKEIYEVKANVE